MTSPKIKTICFDLGGVLFEEGKKVAMKVLADKYGYDPALILPILKSPQSNLLRRAKLTDKEFWDYAKDQLPAAYDIRIIRREWYDGYRLDHDIFKLVQVLRGSYKVALFSGNIKSRIDYLDEKYGFRKHFDQEIYSFDHGLDKDDAGAADFLIQILGGHPDEIVEIDDDTLFLQELRDKGVHGLFYETGRIVEVKRELQALGVREAEPLNELAQKIR